MVWSLTQVVPSYTHISPTDIPSLLDYALLLNTAQLQHCETIPPLSTSDHLGISLTLTLKSLAATICKFCKVWFYREGDYERARELIDETDWNSIVSDCDDHKAAEKWSDQFLAIMEECIHTNIYERNATYPG